MPTVPSNSECPNVLINSLRSTDITQGNDYLTSKVICVMRWSSVGGWVCVCVCACYFWCVVCLVCWLIISALWLWMKFDCRRHGSAPSSGSLNGLSNGMIFLSFVSLLIWNIKLMTLIESWPHRFTTQGLCRALGCFCPYIIWLLKRVHFCFKAEPTFWSASSCFTLCLLNINTLHIDYYIILYYIITRNILGNTYINKKCTVRHFG